MVERNKKKEILYNIKLTENRIRASELENENRLKDQFANTLAIDLKNPLSVALFFIERIPKNLSDVEKVQTMVTKASRSLRRINSMISDLLDSRRVSAGNPLQMEMHKFDLSETLTNIKEDFIPLYGNRFVFIAPEKLELLACEKYLGRAIENLITNAIKYGAEDKPIEVGLSHDDKEVTVWVRNQGKVLTQEDIQKMSKQFVRLNPENISKEGWGIGLNLVKAILEGHNGGLDITSDQNEGTTIRMRFPHIL